MGIALSLLWFVFAAVAGMCMSTFVRIRFDLVERLFLGLLVGTMLSTLAAWLLAWMFGLGAGALWAGLVVVVLAALLYLLQSGGLGTLLFEARALRSAGWRPHGWLALTLIPWTAYFLTIFGHAYEMAPDGLYADYVNIWGDWSAHLGFAGSFAYAHNMPPQFPVLAGHPFTYPYMVDFLAGMMTFNGLNLLQVLPLTSIVLAVCLVALFVVVAGRMAGDRLAGFFGPMVLLLGGGLGFFYLFVDLDQRIAQNGDWIGFLMHLPREYTLDRDINYQWLNPVLAYVIPQRSVLFGLAVGLVTFLLLHHGLTARSWRSMAFAGALLAITPPFHLNTVAAMGLGSVAIFLAFLPWRSGDGPPLGKYLLLWTAYGLPLLLIGLPLALSMLPSNPSGFSFLQLRPGWLAWQYGGKAYHDGFVWFWIKNTGIFILVGLVALGLWDRVRPGLVRITAPMWILFVVPNLYILQPWEWDNTKWFLFWYMAAAITIGALLAWLARASAPARVLAVCVFVVLCLTGAADIWHSLDYGANRVRLLSTEEVQLADWVRTHTSPTAVFLTGDQHNHPVSTLGGRIIFKGYPGWLFTYNLDYLPQEQIAHAIYDTYGDTDDARRAELIGAYHISYVVVGPEELSPSIGLNAKEGFFADHYPVVYRSATYRIYRTSS